ncbi:rhodanese-like domain-containing protein [Sphingomonas mali]|uniref:rhodanese-like domain-containing protein n=1 Tax=Sphingomonas mali TaxID=40682 RepID=UPI000833380D|nr:rhodanese-like domain-containing protein [Sphingomonas mali]
MVDFGNRVRVRELDPQALKAMLDADTAMVVDVREPDEFAAGHIAGAMNLPLSGFDPTSLPSADGKVLVLNCAGGRRSATALGKCAAARVAVDTHLSGGIGAWKAANLPLVTGS